MRKDKAYLQDILEAIKAIESFLSGISKRKFFSSDLIQSAALRKLEVIGEACRQLNKKTTNKYKNVPWRDVADMRNKIIHEYFGVDIERVWQTIQNDIPGLKEQIIQILDEFDKENDIEKTSARGR
jgi:uncharacterized protein with HEPN domain